jgi:two-component system chemotaxis response regulator CheY
MSFMNILVVDDKKLVRDSLFNLLTSCGYEVDCALNGLDALEKVKSGHYQLYIIDHLMPLMNGIQLTKNLKQDEHYKNIPILFMTTQGTEAVKVLPEFQFFSAVINKPINNDKLLDLITQLSNEALPHAKLAAND